MKRSLVLAAFMVFSAAGALLGAPAAHAASSYDDLIQTTDKLIVSSGDSSINLASSECNWSRIFDSSVEVGRNFCADDSLNYPLYYKDENIQSAWNTRNFWSVSLNPDYRNQIQITWTDDPNATIDFDTTSNVKFIYYNIHNGYKVYRINLTLGRYYDKYQFMADSLYTFDSTSTSIQRAILTSGSQLFFAYGNVVYPPDYSGEDIPDSAPREKEKSDVVPDMYVASSTNWLATFYDTRFYTFDNVSWTCSDGLVPVLHLEVWDMNKTPEVMLASNTSSASSEWTYQFQKKTTNQNYRLVSWYECGDEPVFTQSGTYDFTLTGAGTLQTIGLETCLKPDFPWLDINSCISGMNDTLALLTFQRLNPVNDSVKDGAVQAGCHQLGTVGDWIHQSGKTVCPAFSDSIRNTITPFAVLVVAMMTFGIVVVARKARWD